MIDLRSDTVTKPTPSMLEAMMLAEVGDDVWGEDKTTRGLEEKTAALFGMEDAIYCPSGTMTNQIAIRIQTQPQQEVICDRLSHIYNYEGGGIAYNSLASVRLLHGDRGRFTADEVADNINSPDVHFAQTALVCLENTVNKGGGACYDFQEIKAIHEVCENHALNLHLDGARIFNALVETQESPADYGQYFDTISVCFSKGLGAPVGSVLLGSKKLIAKARAVRKVLGGGMRQSGYLSAACGYALDHHIDRLKEDHARAKKLSEAISRQPYVASVLPVATNIVIFSLQGISVQRFVETLAASGIKVAGFGKKEIRMVTHLDFTEAMLSETLEVLNQINTA